MASPFTDATVDASTGPTTPATADPADPTATDATGVGSSTTDGAAPTVTAPEGAATLSPDGPWRLVASAPGVDTPGLVYELMPGLWAYLPVEEDIAAGITWVLTAADVPVIEAYLQAQLTYFRAGTTNPIDLFDPGFEQWFVDGGEAVRAILKPFADRKEHGSLDEGVVLLPEVLGDERSQSSALVLGCMLDGGVFLTSSGELAQGSSWGTVRTGFTFRMIDDAGHWMVSEFGGAEDQCAA